MRIRSYICLSFTALLLAGSTSLHAAVERELGRNNFRTSICNIASMDISVNVDEAYGEPMVRSKIRWTAGPNTGPDCLSKATNVWIRVRTESDSLNYFKVRPVIPSASQSYGTTATESPSWSNFFCERPADSASCENEPKSRQLFSSNLKFEGFEVVSKTSVISSLGANKFAPPRPKSKAKDGRFSLDSMLTDAIDSTIDPSAASRRAAAASASKEPQMTPEQVAAQNTTQLEEQAKIAAKNVLTLVSSSLAQYVSPPHDCESARTIANWVQAPGMCKLNFTRETSHDYLCADNGESRQIKATSRVSINLAEDIAEIAGIRHSPDGWASLTLVLADDLQSTTAGDYKTNRWLITANESRLEDLQQLAGSLMTLVDYCHSS